MKDVVLVVQTPELRLSRHMLFLSTRIRKKNRETTFLPFTGQPLVCREFAAISDIIKALLA